MLTFQRLIVYQRSIEFFALVARHSSTPRGYADLRDQLRRAASSVPANIAEGAGRMSYADGARFYAIARGSAMECAAHLDCLRQLDAMDDEKYQVALGLLGEIVAMLTALLARCEETKKSQSQSQSKSKVQTETDGGTER